jgi:hypothetical protein
VGIQNGTNSPFDGLPITTSLLVAKKFGKQHKHVLRDIENLMAQNWAVKSFFVEQHYVSRGREFPNYRSSNVHMANWINEGLMDYAHKEKMVGWLSKQRYNSADVRKAFNQTTKVINNFENPKILEGKSEKIEKKYEKAVPSAALRAVSALVDARAPAPVVQNRRRKRLS